MSLGAGPCIYWIGCDLWKVAINGESADNFGRWYGENGFIICRKIKHHIKSGQTYIKNSNVNPDSLAQWLRSWLIPG